MIRPCTDADIETIHQIVNDAAEAYRGVIPADCWHEPYMPREQLDREIAAGVSFSGWEEGGALLTALVANRKGLLLLVGTWADATWAIRLYERHGFRLVTPDEKDRLLRTYWTISDRQRETSVVLVHKDRPL